MPARGRHSGSTSTSVPLSIGVDHHGRKLSDADAAQGRETQCHHVLGDEAWCVGDQRSGFVRAVEAPFMMLVRRSPADAWKLDKIGGNKRVAQSLQQHRRRHQPLRALGQHPHHQIVVFQWRKTHPQRDVDAIGDHIDRRGVLSRCTATSGHSAMKRAIISPTWKYRSGGGQLTRTIPCGLLRERSIVPAPHRLPPA